MKTTLIKAILVIPAIGQFYFAIRLFNKNDTVGGIIFFITAIVWSIVALNINKIIKKL